MFQTTIQDEVGVLTLDVPQEPVNALTPEVMQQLAQAVEIVERDASVRGVVLRSGKGDSGFVVGAKIDLLSKLETAAAGEAISRQAQESFDRLERSAKPVVAAIH